MAKNKGWIKLERSIMDHWIFQDAEYLRAWLLFIFLANHEGKTVLINKVPTEIPAGAFHSSLSKIASMLNWNRKRVERYIEVLKRDKMLDTKRDTGGTTFFLINYGKYQGRRDSNGATDGTTHGATDGTQTRMNKNDKELKNARPRARTLQEKMEAIKDRELELLRKEAEDGRKDDAED